MINDENFETLCMAILNFKEICNDLGFDMKASKTSNKVILEIQKGKERVLELERSLFNR